MEEGEEEISIDVPTSPDEPILSIHHTNNGDNHAHHLTISPAELQKKEEELLFLQHLSSARTLMDELNQSHSSPSTDNTDNYNDNDNGNKNYNEEGRGGKKGEKKEGKLPPPPPSSSSSAPRKKEESFKVEIKEGGGKSGGVNMNKENLPAEPLKEGGKEEGKVGGGGGGGKKRACPRAGRFSGKAQSLLIEEGWKFSSLLLSSQLTKLPTFEKISLSASFPSFKKKKEKKKTMNMDSDGEGEEDEGEGGSDQLDLPSNVDNPSFNCKLQSDYLSLFIENQRKMTMEFRNAKIKKQFGMESLSAGFVSSVIPRERNLFIRSSYKPSKSSFLHADVTFLPSSSLTKLNFVYSYVDEHFNLTYYAKKDVGWNVGTMMSSAIPIHDYSPDLLIYAGLSSSAYLSSSSPSFLSSSSFISSPSNSSSDLPIPPRKPFPRSPKKSQPPSSNNNNNNVINLNDPSLSSPSSSPSSPTSFSISDIKLNFSLLFSSLDSSSSLSLFLYFFVY